MICSERSEQRSASSMKWVVTSTVTPASARGPKMAAAIPGTATAARTDVNRLPDLHEALHS